MSTLPLFQSIAQALSPNGLRRTETYDTDIDAYSGNALQQEVLGGAGLPYYGDVHPNNSLIIVTDIGIRPLSPGRSRLTYTYGPPQQAGGVQTTDDLTLTQTAFDVIPTTETVRFDSVRGFKLSTETQEVDGQGDPTGNTIGVAAAGFEPVPVELEHDTARISLVVSGTSADLNINDNEFGSIGSVPDIVNLSRTIHIVGTAALLFRGMEVSWTRNGPQGRLYTIRYEWRYEAGIVNTSANLPEGWTTDPGVGPSTGQWPLFNSRGKFPVDASGDAFEGVAFPNVLALPSLRGIGHIPSGTTQTYTVPPYCQPILEPDPSADFPIPRYTTISRGFERVDQNDAWRQFPGVAQ